MKSKLLYKIKSAYALAGYAGFNIKNFYFFFRGLPYYFKTLSALKKQKKNSDNNFIIKVSTPILFDRFDTGGTTSGHYFHQDLHIAQKIYKAQPIRHIDIGSRVDGFVAHVASYRKIEIIDIRPIVANIDNIRVRQADLMELPDDLIESTDSLSCLHAIEHFGLGRYGDPIDYNGHIKALDNIYKILKEQGTFYFSTPIGKQRIEFNAHRVFSLEYLLNQFSQKYLIKNFSYVDDKGDFHKNVVINDEIVRTNADCHYGCGIFELKKTSLVNKNFV